MDTAALADRLTRLGLTSYEAKAYVALVRRDSYTAAQVSRMAGLPRQRIYDVLGSLVAKGLATARPGTVVKYAAVSPDLAIERLVAGHRAQLVDLERQAAETISALAPAFEAGQSHTDPLEYVELLRDRRAINERFVELQESVTKEILVFTKPPYATPPQENIEGIEVTRTHVAKSVYEFSIFEDAAAIEGIRRFIDAGEEARFVEALPLKLVIIDETTVMIGMRDPVAGTTDLTIMVVEHPELASILKTAFGAVWDQGLTFEQAYDRLIRRRSQTA